MATDSAPDASAEAAPRARTKGLRRKRSEKGGDEVVARVHDAPLPGAPVPARADALSFKTLSPGMTVLAVIRSCSATAVQLSLPHGLVGTVPVGATNDSAEAKVAAAAAGDEGTSSSSSAAASAAMTPRDVLAEMFPVGATVRAVVTNVSKRKSGKSSSSSIQLSMRPEMVASGLDLAHVGQGVVLGCAVRAVEDHGYELETGVEGLRAFLPFQACDGTDGQGHPIVEGSAITCAVVTSCDIDQEAGTGTASLAINATISRRTVRMAPKAAAGLATRRKRKAGAAAAASAAESSLATAPLGTTSIRAGDRVEAVVRRVLNNGLLVQLEGRGDLSSLYATVAMTHLKEPATAFWSKGYDKGDRVVGRVLFASAAEKRISLSLAPHLVDLQPSPCLGVDEAVFGSAVEDAVVTRVEDKLGVMFAFPAAAKAPKSKAKSKAKSADEEDTDSSGDDDEDEFKGDSKAGASAGMSKRLAKLAVWGRVGFAHISRLADEHVDSASDLFRVGSAGHAMRVVGMSECDGIVAVSLEPSVVKAGVISVSQLSPGDVVDAVVEQDAPRGKAVVLRIGGRAKGIVTPLHIGDSASNPTKEQAASASSSARSRPRFRKGQEVRGRVLSAAQNGAVYVTLKPSLVQLGKLPVVATYEEAAALADRLREARRAAAAGGSAKAAAKASKVSPTRGFISAINEARGLAVTLFGGIFGFVSTASLRQRGLLSGGATVGSVFRVGQVVDVVVVRANPARRQLHLELADKSGRSAAAASVGEAGVTYADPRWAAAVAAAKPLSGSVRASTELLAGKAELGQREDGAAPLLFAWRPDGKDGATLWAEVPECCLADHPDVAARLAEAIRAAGPEGIQLHGVLPLYTRGTALVCNVAGSDGPARAWAVMARKPVLVKAAGLAAGVSLLRSVDGASPGQLVAGIVSGHSSAGVFVRFAGRVAGLIPLARVLDGVATDPETVLPMGRTIIAAVEAVDAARGRIVLDARGSTVAKCAARSSDAVTQVETAALRGMLGDEDSAAALAVAVRMEGAEDSDDEAGGSEGADEDSDEDASDADESDDEDTAEDGNAGAAGAGDDEGAAPTLARRLLAPGTALAGTVATILDGSGGVVVELRGPAGVRATGFALASNCAGTPKEGDDVACLVLDVDAVTGIVDVAIVKGGVEPLGTPAEGQRVSARVALIKPGRYAVCAVGADEWPSSSAGVAFLPIMYATSRGHKLHMEVGDDIITTVAASGAAPGAVWSSRSACVLSHMCRSTGAAKETPARRKRSDSTGSLTAALGSTPAKLLQKGQVVAATVVGFVPPEPTSLCGVLRPAGAAAACDVMLKLRHVKGKVKARLSLADLVTSKTTGADEVSAAKHWKSGDSVLVRVLSTYQAGRSLVARVSARPDDIPERVVAAVIEASGPSAPPCNIAHLAAAATSSSAVAAAASSSPAAAADSVDALPAVPFLPCRGGAKKLKAGWIGSGVIEAVSPAFGVVVGFGDGVRGLASPFDACENLESARELGTPASGISPGDVVRVGVIENLGPVSSRDSAGSSARLVLSMRRSVLTEAKAAGAEGDKAERAERQLEVLLRRHRLLVRGEDVFGSVSRPRKDGGTGIATLADMARSFAAETGAKAPVTADEGDVAALRVRVAPRFTAVLSACHAAAADSKTAFPLRPYKDGDMIRAAVLEAARGVDTAPKEGRSSVPTWAASVSLRTSAADAAAEDAEDASALHEGTVVRAFVTGVSRKGCFLQITRRVAGRVLVSDLSDAFVSDPAASFPVGRVVTGVVKKSHPDRSQSDVSLRATDLKAVGATPEADDWAVRSVAVGDVITGRVARVTDFGVFVTLPGGVRGLCHKANFPPAAASLSSRKAGKRGAAASGDLMQTDDFSEGDAVTVQVTKLNAETRKISLSMRISDERAAAASKRSRDEDRQAASSSRAKRGKLAEADDSDDEDSNPEEDGAGPGDEQADPEADGSEDEDEEDSDDTEDEDEEPARASASSGAKPSFGLASSALLRGSQRGRALSVDSQDGSSGVAALSSYADAAAGAEDDEDEDDTAVSSSSAGAAAGSKKAHKSRAERERLEATAAAKEAAIADGTAVPTSEADFERLLAGSPNSSVLWIRFMAFHLGRGDVDKARETGEKALGQVHFRDEQERLNVWVALLNLEASYGTPETLGSVFARATRANDPLKTHRAMLDVFQSLGRAAEADALYRVTLKKFKRDTQTWRDFCRYLLKSGRPDDARKSFREAMDILPERDAPAFAKDFAMLEFRHGTAARGRTMFEDLVASYPRRLDLWLVYIDQEVAHGSAVAVRKLFERVLAGGGLSSKKMRSLFKKWVKFEAAHGDEASLDAVRRHLTEVARRAA